MRKLISTMGSIGIPIAISGAGLLSVALLAMSLQNGATPLWVISENKLLNFTYTMQLMVLPISFIAMTLIYFYNKESFKTFLRLKIGLANTSAEENNWKFLGPLVAVAFTLGTMSYMSVGVISQNGQVNESFYKLLPLMILFAATNAWSEEILSRFVIVSGLYGKLSPDVICWISSIIFGLGHFFGTPNGVFGVIASGVLGWLLAKSVIETKGLGWALFIHFLQDVVIFGAGAMIIAGQH
jgi:uncharacterized protein